MPKLKGLLDSANAKLAGLLGDFPEAFDKGTLYGALGQGGDLAYQADTVGRALTLQNWQPLPQDFPGTSENLAALSGYTVPQSISGQLGWLAGNVMSPGISDLGKIGASLAAIPFWHGSPHKFDRFDLAHMGKGEGAQAYGWGAYGAESKDVAKQYADALQTWKTTINGEPLTPDRPEFSAGMSIAAQGYNKALKDAEDALASGFVDPVAAARQVETIKALKGAKIEAVPESNMYRGEYRWPDPAKEAATPLTGEDLLQWDKPLREQSAKVREAISKLLAPSKSQQSEDDALLAELMSGPGSEELQKAAESVPGFMQMKGADAYRGLFQGKTESVFGNSQNAKVVSERLRAAGIPGIRYLDGGSRADGAGTSNFVVFPGEESALTILERNGKPVRK